MRKINLDDIRRASRELVQRFPVAIAFLCLLTIWTLLHVWDKVYTFSEYLEPEEGVWFKLSDIQNGTIFYYLSIGTVLSLVLRFWGEEVRDRRLVLGVNIASHLLLLADAAFLWFRPEGSIYTELLLAHGALCTALLIAGIFLPFFREGHDLASWNLTLRMVGYAALCPLACGIVSLGLYLLLNSLDWLFGISVNHHWYGSLTAVLMIFVAGTLWMSRLPKGEEKFNRLALTSKFLTGMVRYLFLPLVLGYLLVLYGYGAKILLNMELPKGGVCLLIIVLMMGCLGIELLLYPLQRKAETEGGKTHVFERWLVRWLPIIILPLLVLMTVAIGRRLYDYGITEDRLYVLTLNLWFYAVCLGLFITRARRIHWVSLTFGLLFLLTSALPVNYCSITYDVITSRIDRFFESHDHPELPMSREVFDKFAESLPAKEAEQLRGDLQYIRRLYSQKEIDRYVDKEVGLWRVYSDKKANFEYNYTHQGFVFVPENYHRFRSASEYSQITNIHDSTLWRIQLDDSLVVVLDIEHLPDASDHTTPWLLPEASGKGVYSVTSLEIQDDWNDSIQSRLTLHGYYFEE